MKRIVLYLFIICLLYPINCWAVFPTTGVLDSGVRADQNPLGSPNWTSSPDSLDPLKVLTNVFTSANTQTDVAYWNVGQFGADTEVFVTVNTKGTGSIQAILYARLTNPGGALTCYTADLEAGQLAFKKIIAGTTTTLQGPSAVTFNAGDKFGFSVTGANPNIVLTAWRFSGGSWAQLGTQLTGETSVDGTGYIAFGVRDNVAGDSSFSDFGGGTVVTNNSMFKRRLNP